MQRLQQTMCPRQGAGYALVVPLKGMPATLRLKLTFRPTSFESPHHAGMVNFIILVRHGPLDAYNMTV